MPPRSSLLQIPDEIRAELNRRLVEQGFSDYDGLVDWLNDHLEAHGLELRISRSALARHGQVFQEKLEAMRIATEQARAIAEASEDDEGQMNEALIRLVQTKTFEVLRDLGEGESLHKIGLMVARLSRASVNQKKWAQEAREKTRAKLDALEKEAGFGKGKGKLDKATLQRVREEIYGIYE